MCFRRDVTIPHQRSGLHRAKLGEEGFAASSTWKDISSRKVLYGCGSMIEE
jgi:hypothetical protein